jgi:hypothetical protein
LGLGRDEGEEGFGGCSCTQVAGAASPGSRSERRAELKVLKIEGKTF